VALTVKLKRDIRKAYCVPHVCLTGNDKLLVSFFFVLMERTKYKSVITIPLKIYVCFICLFTVNIIYIIFFKDNNNNNNNNNLTSHASNHEIHFFYKIIF